MSGKEDLTDIAGGDFPSEVHEYFMRTVGMVAKNRARSDSEFGKKEIPI